MVSDKEIRPAEIGAIWLPRPYNVNEDEGKKVVLHFHGGAYVTLSPRSTSVLWGPNKMQKNLPAIVLCPQYRLASNPNGRFPAALQDALSSYIYLLDLGILPSQIILSGDSAGAHLVISLLRYLTDTEVNLPNPSAALLWSPWVNLAATPLYIDIHRNSKSDYITSTFLEWGKRCFVPSSSGMSLDHPYISPLNHPFYTKTPIWIHGGEAEVFYDNTMAFAKNMRNVPGNEVGIYTTSRAPHDIFAAAGSLRFEKEWMEALTLAKQFIGI